MEAKAAMEVLAITFFWASLVRAFAGPDEPHFAVQLNGKFGFINRAGTLVIPATLYAVSEFSDGVAIVMPTRGTGEIIDTNGKSLGKLPLYKSIEPFSDGLAVVMQDEHHWGYVDSKGEIAIPLVFSAATSFSDGLAAVADEFGKWGWIDGPANLLFPRSLAAADNSKKAWRVSLVETNLVTWTRPAK